MKAAVKQSGLTLIEMTVVIAIAAILVAFGLPAIRVLFKSFESASGTKAMIDAALSSARAIAAKEQHYAGLRFQNKYQPDGKGCQYMIFVMHDTEIANSVQGNLGCRAVEGLEPIKLPDSIGVMEVVSSDNEIDTDEKVTDKTTFTILFSPSGKLIVHSLWVRNRDNVPGNSSADDIFNTEQNVTKGIGMFLQDVSGSVDLPIEESRNSFVIYDRNQFKSVEAVDRNHIYNNYLVNLEVVHINPYTGTMINRQ